MALTKQEISESLHGKLGLNKREAKEIVELVYEQIALALERGEMVKLSGFGNFMLRDKKTRPGRNPKTGDVVMIKPRRVVTFRAGQKLRTRVEQYANQHENRTEDK